MAALSPYQRMLRGAPMGIMRCAADAVVNAGTKLISGVVEAESRTVSTHKAVDQIHQ